MKTFWRVVGIAVALLAVGSVWLVLWVRSAGPTLAGVVRVAGLSASVEVGRDSLGVPHVWAEDEQSLLFAQGWVHAQDRLWQMELFRRVAEGRLAEVLGPDFIDTDRFLRTAGVWRAAARQEQATAPETLRLLEAYAAGVNAWIEQNDDALPPELLVLRIRPEPWTARHTLAIEKIMAWDLSAYGQARQFALAARSLPPDRIGYLLPAFPDWAPTIIAVPPPVPRLAAQLIEMHSITRASNAWVIGGTRTRSGKPILANDMHLALRAPSIWYLMALHEQGLDVAGMSLPGTPFIVAGHNRAVAWGFTNAMVDDVDFFIEKIDPADAARYLVPGGSEAFETEHERIAVRGADTVDAVIRFTRHGPVLEDVEPTGQGNVISLSWAAVEPSTTFSALRSFNRAARADDVIAAIALFDNPHQNVVYADTAGHFGYRMAGRIPVRGTGQLPPVVPVPGWTGEWDWTGFMPREDHPATADPLRGYVVTANNRQTANSIGDRISRTWELPYRAARIQQMIDEAGPLDADAVHAMQLDIHDAFAERYADLAVAAARRSGDTATARSLADWDLRAWRGSTGAAVFYVWVEETASRVRASLFDGQEGWLPRSALGVVLDSASLHWLGPQGSAAFDSIAVDAMAAATRVADGRTWGDLHRVTSTHALSAASLLERGLDLNVGPVAGDGSPTTVNVSHYGSRFPLDAEYGPSQRHVVDMGDIDGAGGFILPTGQSGIPFEHHYRDQFQRWLGGGLWAIPLDPDRAAARIIHRLTLTPSER